MRWPTMPVAPRTPARHFFSRCCALIDDTPSAFRVAIRQWPETKKPTASFASGGGLETFPCWLAVSPRARSDSSARSRSERLGRRAEDEEYGKSQHIL